MEAARDKNKQLGLVEPLDRVKKARKKGSNFYVTGYVSHNQRFVYQPFTHTKGLGWLYLRERKELIGEGGGSDSFEK